MLTTYDLRRPRSTVPCTWRKLLLSNHTERNWNRRLRHTVLEEYRADLLIAYWLQALYHHDRETEAHTRRVTMLTTQIACLMGFSGYELIHIRRGAQLHDIGKLYVPGSILRKPAILTGVERQLIQRHPLYASVMITPIKALRPALAIPLHHHERWNGSGYPHGLRETQIPIAARIFAVIDVWDALCSDRPYHHSQAPAAAIEYIVQHAGSEFDPEVVHIFSQMISLQMHTHYHRKETT